MLDYFNPLPPWGGRRFQYSSFAILAEFQSTPSVGRETAATNTGYQSAATFQSTPSVGRETLQDGKVNQRDM